MTIMSCDNYFIFTPQQQYRFVVFNTINVFSVQLARCFLASSLIRLVLSTIRHQILSNIDSVHTRQHGLCSAVLATSTVRLWGMKWRVFDSTMISRSVVAWYIHALKVSFIAVFHPIMLLRSLHISKRMFSFRRSFSIMSNAVGQKRANLVSNQH